MAQQPARPTIRAGQAIGLTVFLVTAGILTALLGSRVTTVFDSLPMAAAWVSTLCATAAVIAMLVDSFDLWLRGRTLAAKTVRFIRILVFVAMIGALAASLVGTNSLVIPILLPSLFIYLFIVRRRPVARPATAARAARGGSSGRSGAGSAKSRQRRGGKKRR